MNVFTCTYRRLSRDEKTTQMNFLITYTVYVWLWYGIQPNECFSCTEVLLSLYIWTSKWWWFVRNFVWYGGCCTDQHFTCRSFAWFRFRFQVVIQSKSRQIHTPAKYNNEIQSECTHSLSRNFHRQFSHAQNYCPNNCRKYDNFFFFLLSVASSAHKQFFFSFFPFNWLLLFFFHFQRNWLLNNNNFYANYSKTCMHSHTLREGSH